MDNPESIHLSKIKITNVLGNTDSKALIDSAVSTLKNHKDSIKREPENTLKNIIKIKQEVLEIECDENYTNDTIYNETDEVCEERYQVDNSYGANNGYTFVCNMEDIKTEMKSEIDEEYEDDIIVLKPDNNYTINSTDIAMIESVNDFINKRNTVRDETDRDNGESLSQAKMDDNVKWIATNCRKYTCGKCNFTSTHREFKVHMEFCTARKRRKTEGELKLTCTKCKELFPSMYRYVNHFVQHGLECLECPQCNQILEGNSQLISHYQLHIKSMFIRVSNIGKSVLQRRNKFFMCKKCERVVNKLDSFKHWESHLEIKEHSNADEVKTDMVMTTPSIQWIIDIIANHDWVVRAQSKTVKTTLRHCKLCDKSFGRNNDAKRHFIEHLLDDAYSKLAVVGSLKCQICGEKFEKCDGYRCHMRFHASLPIYKCELCNKNFSDSSNFAKHKKLHNLSVLICDICNKKFHQKHFLIKHLQMHEETKPVICKYQFCRKVFFSATELRKHRRLIHDKNYWFNCKICKTNFKALRLKWDHMWQEHKLRKRKADCPICGKEFRKFQDVQLHLRADHQVKGKKFTSAQIYKPLKNLNCDQTPKKIKSKPHNFGNVVHGKGVDPDTFISISYIKKQEPSLV